MQKTLDKKWNLHKHTIVFDSEEGIDNLTRYLKNLLKTSKQILVTGVHSGFSVYDKSTKNPNIRFKPTINYAANSFKIKDLSMKPYVFLSVLAIKDKEE